MRRQLCNALVRPRRLGASLASRAGSGVARIPSKASPLYGKEEPTLLPGHSEKVECRDPPLSFTKAPSPSNAGQSPTKSGWPSAIGWSVTVICGTLLYAKSMSHEHALEMEHARIGLVYRQMEFQQEMSQIKRAIK